MSVEVSQITDNSAVCLTFCSGFQQRKHPFSALLALRELNQPVTGGLPPQRASSEENLPMPLRQSHDDVIKWKHFPRCYWPFVRGINRSPVNSPHKGQWRRTLTFSLICAWTNDWVNNPGAGDLRRHCAHYDLTIMCSQLHKRDLNSWSPFFCNIIFPDAWHRSNL